jgi:hypothetical protein
MYPPVYDEEENKVSNQPKPGSSGLGLLVATFAWAVVLILVGFVLYTHLPH